MLPREQVDVVAIEEGVEERDLNSYGVVPESHERPPLERAPCPPVYLDARLQLPALEREPRAAPEPVPCDHVAVVEQLVGKAPQRHHLLAATGHDTQPRVLKSQRIKPRHRRREPLPTVLLSQLPYGAIEHDSAGVSARLTSRTSSGRTFPSCWWTSSTHPPRALLDVLSVVPMAVQYAARSPILPANESSPHPVYLRVRGA